MKKKPTPEQLEASRAKRAELAALSRRIHLARKSGVQPFTQHATTNEGLVYIYSQRTGQNDWASFLGWKDRGFAVKKGEKGFPIWGEPIRSNRGAGEAPADAPEGVQVAGEEGKAWFPIAHLFHAGQVQDAEGNAPATAARSPQANAYEVPTVETVGADAAEPVTATAPLLLMAPGDAIPAVTETAA